MRTLTKTIEAYKFDELPEDIKEKVISNNYDINIDHEWWEFMHDDFHEKLKKIGMSCKTFYWSIDRDNFIYMEKPSVDDVRLLLKSAGCDLRKKDIRELLETGWLSIGTQYYPGRIAENYIDADIEGVDLSGYLESVLSEFLSELRKSYDYLTGEKQIIETLKINEYEFDSQGNIVN